MNHPSQVSHFAELLESIDSSNVGIAILSITKPQYLEERTLGPEDGLVAPESLLPHHHVHVGQVSRVQQLQQSPTVPGLSLLWVRAGLGGRAPQ